MSTVSLAIAILASVSSEWSAAADFNADGTTDILWRNRNTGAVVIWPMNGQPSLGGWIAGSDWVIQGVGDFNGDGKTDVLWRNSTTGAVTIWLMNGSNSWSSVGGWVVSYNWMIQGVGDFNGDGKSDILWRDMTTGLVTTWLMNGGGVPISSGSWAVDSSWTIQGAGDFDGDGKSDILWRNTSTGAVVLWFMNGQPDAGGWIADSEWVIQSVGDFNGDGKSDILWRNRTTGAVTIWLMNGGSVPSFVSAGTANSDWVIQSADDFNGDGKSDILWRNKRTGVATIWHMNGGAVLSQSGSWTVSGDWVVQPPRPLWGEFTAEPVGPIAPESLGYKIASAAVQNCNVVTPVIVAPAVRVDDFGAKGDGVTDDTAAINRAVQSLSAGGTVVFTPGKTYLKRGRVAIRRSGVKLWGYGAIIYSVITDAEVAAGAGVPQIAIGLEAPNTGVYGFTFISNLRAQLVGHQNNSGIYIQSDNQQVVDNRFEYTQNGVIVVGATNFLITRNVVYRTWSDGIHITHDSYMARQSDTGRVLCNVVRQTGDDMISVVSYGIGEPYVRNVLIEGNDVADQYWGRGIAVVGGRDVTIRNNKVATTTHGAGIYVNSEVSWRTSNVRNVLVEHNQVTDVQTTRPPYNPTNRIIQTGQGAIDINGQSSSQEVTQVLVRNNTIVRAMRDGVFVRGNSRDIAAIDNTMSTLGREAVRNEVASGALYCGRNTLNGVVVATTGCTGPLPAVTGASF